MRYLLSVVLLFLFSFPGFTQNEKRDALVTEGIKLHDAGDYKGAVEKYREALLVDSTSAMVYYEMAFSYHMAADFENALKYADKALAQKDNESVALSAIMVKGSIIDDQGKPKEAIKIYEEAIKKYPDQYLLFFNYGISLGRVGRKEEAVAALQQALQLKPSHPGSHLQLSTMQMEQGHRTKSILGLYFFLMLENNSARAADAYARLKEFFYKGVTGSKDEKTITVVVADKGDDVWTTIDMSVSIIAMASGELNKGKEFLPTFVSDTQHLFRIAGEMKDNAKPDKKKKKKKVEEESGDFWMEFYVPFFYELEKAGHTEAFIYYIAQAGGEAVASEWVENNKQKMEYFFLWANNH